MPNLGATELIIILAIVVILFGASRIPEVMGGMGKGIREFRKATRDDEAIAAKKREDAAKLEEANSDVS